jgi:hypothetical protein
MRSRSRLITRELKLSDFKCDLVAEEKLTCDDCGVEMKYALQIIGKRVFCRDCAPWYKEQAEIDRIALEMDSKRAPRVAVEQLEAELDYGERDYWD